ncbi:AAA family ATPase [Actinoplanes sp. NPDC051411]|uniref:AAA family ATPase n=1 Tax=Actinoplanes sp. NPDC051411 TaxID=3155522 RepID=UPI003441EC6D
MVTLAAPRGAPWLVRAYHELQRRRHLVLYGNVDDLVRWNDRYQPFGVALKEFLAVAGFTVIVRYNLVEGLTYHDDASRAFVQRYLGDPAAARPPARPPAEPANGDGTRRNRLVTSADVLEQQLLAGRAAAPRTAIDVLAVALRLMNQVERPCVFIVESADLLVGTASQLSSDHVTQVAYVRRLLGADSAPAGERPQHHNTMILVARDLSALPAWLHRDNPNVAAVLADRPAIAERAAFLRGDVAGYYGGDEMTADQLTEAAGTLASLTDGMTIVDIGALNVTSQVARIPPSMPRRLVARHRFGLRDDPWEQLDIGKIKQAEQLLSRRVIGQPAAVRAVTDVLVNARVGLDFVSAGQQTGTRPKGVFFFVGPTGVGKTELAKALAELVFDDESALRRFDMSEYSQEHNAERLTGAPPGYVGHEHGGTLTNWVLERPFSVLLFDEIEKAHEKIMDKFLQIIDDGRLTDGQGRTAHFSHSIVIFTSNIGSGDLRRTFTDPAMSYEAVQQHFNQAVADHFATRLRRPEILGRLGSGIVVFDLLRENVIMGICDKFLEQIAAAAQARGYDLVFDRAAIGRAVVDEIVRGGAALGARQIRSPLLEQWVRIPLNRWLLEHQPAPGTRILVHRSGDGSPPFAVDALGEATG